MADQFREESIRATLPEVTSHPDNPATAAIRKAMAESGKQSPLEAFKAAAAATENINTASSGLLIRENIGTEVDSSGKKRLAPEEQARLQSADKFEKTARLLIEKGYDHADFATYRDDARNSIEGMLRVWPELTPLIPTDPAEKEQFLAEILKDPKLVEIVRNRYAQAFSKEKKLTDEVTAVRDELAAAKKAEQVLKDKKRDTDRELRDLDAVLARFETRQPDAVELQKLTADLPKNQERLDLAQSDIDESGGDIAIYKTARAQAAVSNPGAIPAIEAEISRLQGVKKLAEKRLTDYGRRIQKQRELADLKSTSETRRNGLRGSQGDLATELDAATRTRLHAQASFEQENAQRAVDEQTFVESLDILPSAFAEYESGKLQKSVAASIEHAKTDETATTDRAEKAIARQRQIRWDKDRKPDVLNSATREPNKPVIDGDYETLVALDTGKGPDAVIESMLRAELAKDVAAGTMTQVDADAYFAEKMKDAVFLAKVRPDVVRDLLAVRLRSGGKIDRSQAQTIVSNWGKGMIEQAINKNSELKDALEKLKQQGVLKGDILTALKDNPNLLFILLGIIGGTIALSAGMTLLAGGSVVGGGALSTRRILK